MSANMSRGVSQEIWCYLLFTEGKHFKLDAIIESTFFKF